MSKDTFRGLIAGMLIMGLFFTGIPVSADTTDTFSNRLVAAVNALKGSTDTTATKIGGVATAINNQSSALSAAIGNISTAGSSGSNSEVRAQCMGTSSSSGPGFVVVFPFVYTGGAAASRVTKVTLDGQTITINNNYLTENVVLNFQSSASLANGSSSSALYGAVFKYV